MNWYIVVLKKYAVFEGRARRSEYWYFVLFNIIISLVLGFIDGLLGTYILGILYMLAVLVPSIAVGIRRLHDIGKSGWWLLIALIPILGAIILIVFAAMEGQPDDNQYGPNPKQFDSQF